MMKLEFQILDMINQMHSSFGDVFFPIVTALGNKGLIWILLTIILLLPEKTRKSGVILGIALCVDLVLCNGILKNLFARVRPFNVNTAVQLLIPRPLDYSFPSGHTAASFAAVSALFFAGRKRLAAGALILALLIAFSRMYLYVHYPTDILGGMAVGVLFGYLGFVIGRVFIKRLVNHKKAC